MNILELKKIIKNYPDDTEIVVLHKLRENGVGRLLEIFDIKETINQDTNKCILSIETEDFIR